MLWIWIVFPVIGGAIGWLTNVLAVKMIFRPRHPRRILGFRFQGLLPKRRHELAESIADTVETKLVSGAEIRAVLADEGFLAVVRRGLSERLGESLLEKLRGIHPMAPMFVTPAIVEKIREPLLDKLFQQLPEIIEEGEEHIAERLNLRQRILDKVEAFEMDQLEDLVMKVARKELVAIEYLGGILGLFIGLAQAGLLTVLGTNP